jgi:anti-anti-sigma regulatory factor
LVRGVDVVISCLTNDQIVYSVYTAAEGVFAGARPGTVVLEMSTISPESSRELHRLRARNGIEVLDVAPKPEAPAPTRFAPVSISPFTSAVTSNSALAVGTVYYTSRLVTTRLSTLTLKIIDLQSDRFGTHIAFNVCMLKVSVVEGRKRRWLVVEGRLVAPWSDELRAACERAASGLDGRELVIDLKNLTTISEQGADLLLKLRQQGLKCRGCGVFTKEILKQVARRLRRNGAHE